MRQELVSTITFLGLVIGTIVVGYFLNRFLKNLIRKSTAILKNDPTNYQFFRHFVVFLVYIVGFSLAIYSLPSLQTLARSLLAGAGIIAVAVGFASQHAFSNIISGIFIIIFKPFRINDRLRIRDLNGVVEDITLRHTVIRDFENRRIIIPNAVISNEILINADFEDERICKWIDFSISYSSNIDRAKEIIREEILSHPMHIDGRNEEQKQKGKPIVEIRVISLGQHAVNIRAWAWAKNQADSFAMNCDLNELVKKRFDAEGIEIPYPYYNIVHKGPSNA